jgi:hypothetical protein
MLGWLKSSDEPDHPLADPRTAKTTLAAIVAQSPVMALEVLGGHLESIREAVRVTAPRIFDIVDAIDVAAKPLTRRLGTEFLKPLNAANRASQMRVAHVTGNYWNSLATAYRMLLEMIETGDPSAGALKPRLALIAARAIRAFNLHLKWRLLRYVPVDVRLWGSLARVWSVADRRGVARDKVVVYPGAWGESSVERELLKALMLSVSSTDSLPKLQVEIVERLCAQYSEFFALQPTQSTGVHFQFDTEADRAPSRHTGEAPHGVRFFGPSEAATPLKQLAEDIRLTGTVPSTVNLGADYPAQDLIEVLEHLARYWSPLPPSRRESRRYSQERVQIVRGFEQVLAAVDADEFGWGDDDVVIEDWSADNESPGGIGLLVPPGLGDWVALGELVGIKYQEEGAAWGAGIVRRITQGAEGQRYVGIELHSRGVIRVLLHALRADGSHHADPALAVNALLLPSSSDNSLGRLTMNLLMRVGSFVQRDSYGLTLYGMDYLLVPKTTVAAGDDYVILSYRLLQRAVD